MAELDRAAISLRLAQSRDETGLTQPEMADALGDISWRAIQNYESPKVGTIPFDRLDEWAKITGKTKEWLLHGEVTADAAGEELEQLKAELAEVRRGLTMVEEVRDAVTRIEALLRKTAGDARSDPASA